ncbi:MAG TPA: hypothetical protein VH092_11570 [Urbifossiella sp.]|jgi:hypothetical protein|nr:hypothetical protein [Urbifossiella sp.]
MEISAFLIAGAVLAMATAVVVSTRSGIQTALAGQTTVVGLADPAAETVASGPRTTNRTDWQLTTVDNLTAAEDLLDCLEAHGFGERELVVLGNSSFAVRWR